jgi:hypothetical protein
MGQHSSKELLDSIDLKELSGTELLDHLDRVSSEVKRRNDLYPKTQESAATEILSVLQSAFNIPK